MNIGFKLKLAVPAEMTAFDKLIFNTTKQAQLPNPFIQIKLIFISLATLATSAAELV